MINRKKLIKIIYDFFNSSEFYDVANDICKQTGFALNDLTRMRIDKRFIRDLPDDKLFLLAYTLQQLYQQILDVNDFYNAVENRNYKNAVINPTTENELRILKYAVPLSDGKNNQYVARLSVSEIAQMYNRLIIRLDATSQRESRIIYSTDSDDILRCVEVDLNKVKEIADMICEDTYSYDAIRLNLMYDGSNNFEYTVKNIKDNDEIKNIPIIKLPQNGDVIIPDGNHRCKACVKAYSERPDLRANLFDKRYFTVLFTNFTSMEVRRMLDQTWKFKVVSNQVKKYVQNTNSNRIVHYIKASEAVDIRILDNISTTMYPGAYTKGRLISFVDLSEAIQESYRVNSNEVSANQCNKIGEWLIKFMNKIVETVPEFFETPNVSGCFFHKANIYSIIELSKFVKDKENWEYIVENTIKNIDYKNIKELEGWERANKGKLKNITLNEAEKYV